MFEFTTEHDLQLVLQETQVPETLSKLWPGLQLMQSVAAGPKQLLHPKQFWQI